MLQYVNNVEVRFHLEMRCLLSRRECNVWSLKMINYILCVILNDNPGYGEVDYIPYNQHMWHPFSFGCVCISCPSMFLIKVHDCFAALLVNIVLSQGKDKLQLILMEHILLNLIRRDNPSQYSMAMQSGR